LPHSPVDLDRYSKTAPMKVRIALLPSHMLWSGMGRAPSR
jgi:hypothetical protein